MTEIFNTGQKNGDILKLHASIYGGQIDLEDFDTESPNGQRIKNQMEAINLYKNVNKEKEKTTMMEKYKTMTFDELRQLKAISDTNGRPASTLTDQKWQTEFEIRKLFITPIDKKHNKMGGKYSKESSPWNAESNGEYCGTTNWQQYCMYINDILRNIRAGQVDYCYFLYQIIDLLKFHHDDLRTKYRDGYWEVWLDTKTAAL